MYKYLWLIFWCLPVLAEPLKIVVVDTGIYLQDVRFKSHMCKEGHKDFTGTGLKDTIGHGTAITGLIQKWAADSDYCIVMLKFFTEKDTKEDNWIRYMYALKKAVSLHPYAINLSLETNDPTIAEINLVKNNPAITFLIAAGNSSANLDNDKEHPYLSSYPLANIISVGNGESNLKRGKSSNYGWAIKQWVDGSNILVEDIKGGQSFMSGTSASVAIYAGKFIYALYH